VALHDSAESTGAFFVVPAKPLAAQEAKRVHGLPWGQAKASVARVSASLSFELYGLPLRRGVDPSWLLTLRLARRGFLFRFLPGNGGNFAACYRV
jgi:hypothetical protein